MAARNAEMTHDEIWDDSALVDSWNQALDEYKKYHSIQAKGGSLEDIDLDRADETGWNAKPETTGRATTSQLSEDGEIGDDVYPHEGETATAQRGMSADAGKKDIVTEGHVNGPALPNPMAPPGLLASIKDDGLKKLLMSWYYAGYYTGLYEGQQQAAGAAGQPDSDRQS